MKFLQGFRFSPFQSLADVVRKVQRVVARKVQRVSFWDLSKLIDAVRMKDMNSLRDLGGVKGVIKALGSHPENGISDDIEARNKFSNLYLQPATAVDEALLIILSLVSLFCSVIERPRDMDMISILLPELFLLMVVVIVGFLLLSPPDHDLLSAPRNVDYSPQVEVVRKGVWRKIPISRVVVGDVVFLKPGDVVPGDGLFIKGHSLQLKNVKSRNGRFNGKPACVEVGDDSPFIYSGYMVVQGYSKMVVTATDSNLPRVTCKIAGFGKHFAMITFMWFLFRFCRADQSCDVVKDRKGEVVELLIAPAGTLASSVIISSISSLVGLVLAVKLTLAYSMRSLFNDHVLIKEPALCHQLASVHTVCFNKTVTLTSDFFEVDKFWLGLSSMEAVPHNKIATSVLKVLHQAIGLSTILPCQSSTGTPSVNLSEDAAISKWATIQLDMKPESIREGCTTLKIEPFNRARRWSGMLISKFDGIHVHRKGAADVILPMCSHFYDYSGAVNVITDSKRVLMELFVKDMERSGLRCIAFAHKRTFIEGYFNSSEQKLALLGILGIKNTVRDGVRETVKDLQRAGINSKLLTGDSTLTATFMAIRGGLLDPDFKPGQVVEGKEFRNFTLKERMERVHQIRVLAKASPSDKLLMVESLKQNGRVVAYLGRGQGDLQALQEANVGICFGTEGGAEILKSCSDIVIKNKDFPLVIKIIKWGRGSYYNIQAYTQFLLTATFVDLVVSFVMAIYPSYTQAVVSSSEVQMPMFQLLWLKLIQCTVAVLQVLQPSDDLMSKPGRNPEEPLITDGMQRNIIAQALYQVIVLLAMHFKGNSILKLNPDVKNAVIFNTCVLCQVFALINAKIYDRKNIFLEIHNKKWFWGIIGIVIVLQVMMVEVWNSVAGTARLDSRRWALCTFIAAASTPISGLLRYICPINTRYLGFIRKSE